jgi:flagellar P-ring protein precursor FlgI
MRSTPRNPSVRLEATQATRPWPHAGSVRARSASRPWPMLLGLLIGILCASWSATPAHAGQVQDFVRVRGLEGDLLVGMGLVVGLDGTGDSLKDSMIAGQPYAQLLKTLGNVSSSPRDLQKLKVVAVVLVTVDIPYGGSRIGDRIDAKISTLGTAKSIKGGRLVSTYMLPDVVPADRDDWVAYAIAEGGSIEVADDNPTNGVLRSGARLVRDIIKNPFDGDRVTLVLEPRYQGFPAATAIAAAINDENSLAGDTHVASVIDHQTILIRIPENALDRRNEFLAQILGYSMSADALRLRGKIIIDKRRKVITVDESVQFRPSAVSADGLRITAITPPPTPTPESPVATSTAWTSVATDEKDRKTNKLRDLLDALKQLEVGFDTQVAIIESLERQGALTGELVIQ